MPTPVDDLLNALGERIRAVARIETVVGETRTVDGRSIIPVAKLVYGFGGGAGSGPRRRDATGDSAGGGGGGGGGALTPLGFLVVSPEGERFVAVRPRRRELALAFIAGVAAATLLSRRIR